MYTQASQRPGTKLAFLHAIFEFLLSKLTSRHGKRILFVTSLYFQVVRLERLKAEAITKLNDLMGLASSEAALGLPVAIRGVVWRNTDLHTALNEEMLDEDISEAEAKEISERVVDLAPKWIHYGRRVDMVTDVLTLIRNGSQLAAAA